MCEHERMVGVTMSLWTLLCKQLCCNWKWSSPNYSHKVGSIAKLYEALRFPLTGKKKRVHFLRSKNAQDNKSFRQNCFYICSFFRYSKYSFYADFQKIIVILVDSQINLCYFSDYVNHTHIQAHLHVECISKCVCVCVLNHCNLRSSVSLISHEPSSEQHS